MRYIHVKKSGIYFVFILCSSSLSPACLVELLNKLIRIMRDFCGVLSEESLRRNFILIYELIDEAIDAGYPQTTASEVLKLSIRSDAVEPVSVSATSLSLASIPNPFKPASSAHTSSTIPSSANQRPLGMTAPASGLASAIGNLNLPSNFTASISGLLGQEIPVRQSVSKNEIFVDIIERVSAVIRASDGQLVSGHIDGSIQMKSYLSGNPMLRLCLNEDLIISTEDSALTKSHQSHSSSSVLDDVLFHECADLSEFETGRIISITPPDGEFVLMNYRVSEFNSMPFRVNSSVLNVSADRVDVSIVVRADIPEQNHASNMLVTLHLPKGVVKSVSNIQGGEHVDNSLVWNVKKLNGNQEVVFRAKLILASPVTKLFSHVSLNFEIPMYSLSNMQVKYLRINSAAGYMGSSSPVATADGPYRWVRYVTQSQSYATR